MDLIVLVGVQDLLPLSSCPDSLSYTASPFLLSPVLLSPSVSSFSYQSIVRLLQTVEFHNGFF